MQRTLHWVKAFLIRRKPKEENGAAEKNRTSDPVITNDVLYH